MKFVKTDYRTLELNPMTLIGDEWMLVTAGDDQTGWNTMTASWGHLGYIWQRPTAICYIRPQRYTRQFADREPLYSLSFFPEGYKKQLSYLGSHSGRDEDKVKTVGLTPVFGDGYTYFEEAKLVLVCRKLYQAPLLEQGRGRLGAYLYGIDVSGLEETVLHLLHQHGKTFSAAESCTGGLIAKRITDLPGASCVFRGGVVSYTNEVKASVLGVPQETLDRYGAVSEPVARAMAEGVRRITGSDLSVATTGLAGPDGDDRGNPVGTVFVALSTPERTAVRHMNCGSGRDRVRMLASHCAFDLLRRELEHLPIEGE